MEKEDNKSEKEELFSGADKENNSSPNHVSVEIPASETSADSRRRVLHRVPPQVRERKTHIYDPVVLSIGPYHHGQPQFQQVEKLKDEVLDIMLDSKDKGSILSRIRERVNQIRDFYGGLSVIEYDDDALAEMMVRDGCFVLYYMEIGSGDEEKDNHSVRRLGLSGVAFMYRDFLMLENQIPLWLIKLLFDLIYDEEDQWEALLYKFLSEMNFGDDRLSKIPWEPLHILEAHRATLTNIGTIRPTANVHHHRRLFRFQWGRKKAASQSSVFETVNSQFRSVTYLKAKGIHFGPSSNCLTDIRFNSYLFYGKLQLPIWFVTNNSKVFFSNLIAFEMSPETDNDFAVISYINFMKSLIDEPKDVKELREKDILFSCLANDEEVFRMFKEMDTYGMDNIGIFQDVKKRIDEHCDSRGKTWMAELIHTYFRSPWTAIALFAATVLLCITFLQTFYTMHPPKKGNNPKMFGDFKRAMSKEFEMMDIGLMSYYLGIEVKQQDDGIFVSQEGYAKEILKKFEMENCKSVSTPVECGVKMYFHEDCEKINSTYFKSLVGSLRYLTCTRPDILFGVGLISRHMEAPTTSHLKVAKRILRYIKGTVDHGIFYTSSHNFKLVGYCDSDWVGDVDSHKSTTGFVFFMGSSAFTWNSKKQPIVTLSTCEAEYVAATSCVCHAIWLRSLLKELSLSQGDPTEIYVDNKSAIALAKNPVFHDISKHIDTKYHFIREHISKKEVKLEFVKSQDQIADIFTKPLRFDFFKKLRFSLRVMNLA